MRCQFRLEYNSPDVNEMWTTTSNWSEENIVADIGFYLEMGDPYY